MIGGIFGAIKALSVVQKVSGALSFLPGVGVLPGIVSAVLGAILGLVRTIFAGVTVMVANPATLVTALALGVGTLVYGIKLGRDWTDHRVETLRAQHTRQLAQIKTDSERAAADKRRAAEEAAKGAPAPETPTEIAALCQRSASCREKKQP